MARVKLSTPTEWEGIQRKAGDVIDVPDTVAELNPWMVPTDEPVTPTTKTKKTEE